MLKLFRKCTRFPSSNTNFILSNIQVTVDQTIGKGAVAAGFKLTHLIDDRAECLTNFFEEGYLATLSTPSKHGGLMNFGTKAVGCNKGHMQKIWRRCSGTPSEAWTHVLNCFGLGHGGAAKAAKASKAERNAKRDAARAKREAKLEAQKKKQREKQRKQKRQQALSKVKSNKVTYEAIATWLQISCKHLTTESDPTFDLTLPPWLARRDEFMERMEADDNMMLDVFELEKFLVAAVKELGAAYFGSDFEFDPLFSEVKSIVESDRRIGQRDGLPPWIRCASDLLSPDEMELACTAIDAGGDDGDDQSWDSTEGSDSDSGSGSSSDSDSDSD